MDTLDYEAALPAIPSLVSLLIDSVLQNKLVDDTKLLEATSASEGSHSLCTFVSHTYADLPMDLQHRVMERAVELAILDDFWIGYFIPGIHELGALNARGCNITDAGIELLVGGCPSLLSLDISFCSRITNKGFVRLVGTHLISQPQRLTLYSHCYLLTIL